MPDIRWPRFPMVGIRPFLWTNEMVKERKNKNCKKCGKSLEGEHPAAKTCTECRTGTPKKVGAEVEKVAVQPMGEIVNIHDPDPTGPLPAPAPQPAPSPVATPFFLRTGDTISLNLKQRKFFRIPRSEFALTPRKWSGEIPEDFDAIQLRMCRIALEAGDIIKGKVYTGIQKDDKTLRKAEKILGLTEPEFRTAVGKIVQHKGLVGGYIPHEIFRHMMRYEDDNDHRRRVLDFLQSAMDHVGPGPIKSTPVINTKIEEVTELKRL